MSGSQVVILIVQMIQEHGDIEIILYADGNVVTVTQVAAYPDLYAPERELILMHPQTV